MSRAWLPWGVAALSFLTGIALVPSAIVDRMPAVSAPWAPGAPLPGSRQSSPVAYEALQASAVFRADRTVPTRRYSENAITSDEGESAMQEDRPGWRLTGIVRVPDLLGLFQGVGDPSVTRILGVGHEVDGYRLVRFIGDTAVVSNGRLEWRYELEATWR